MGVDVKHLRAAVALAEERNFTRAASRLRIGQSGLTKQILALEEYVGYCLFIRGPRDIEISAAGEAFVAEAKLSLQHIDRALNLSKLAQQGAESVLHVGKSPYTDPFLVTKLFSLHMPLAPNARIEVSNKLTMELHHDLLVGKLDVAFLSGVPDSGQITSVAVGDQPLFAVMLQTDPLARKRVIGSDDLRVSSCILTERHVQPLLYDSFIRLAAPASAGNKSLHHVMTAEEALPLVMRGVGVAILTQAEAWRVMRAGVTIRPVEVGDIRFETRLATRSDNRSRLVSDFVRSFVRLLPQHNQSQQIPLALRN